MIGLSESGRVVVETVADVILTFFASVGAGCMTFFGTMLFIKSYREIRDYYDA